MVETVIVSATIITKANRALNILITKANRALNILRKLKWVMDRNTLEKLYCSQVRPILEYADTVWLNCNQMDKDRLEAVQLDAIRLILAAPRGTSHQLLYTESGIETLEKRRHDHQMVLYYKMVNRLTPPYLFLHTVHRQSHYQLRNTADAPIQYTRTCSYHDSFIPSSPRAWNLLSPRTRNAPTIDAFKRELKRDRHRTPKYYLGGERRETSIHSNMRMNSSNLAYHKFTWYISEDPQCICGAAAETPAHFFRDCQLYNNLRGETFGNQVPRVEHLLYGSDQLNLEENIALFKKVHIFIKKSNRFT